MDMAIEYSQKISNFVSALNAANPNTNFTLVTGRKFDKVVQDTMAGVNRYMVDRNSWVIYGAKSWAQINTRRVFGSLHTIDQYDWTGIAGTPKSGTLAEIESATREAAIRATYKKCGRPRKATV